MNRREELLQQVTDYVLSEGLIGLTLRPLADAIGTSDRMLIYHFGNRDALVTAVVVESTRRAIEAVERVPAAPTIRSAVNRLWSAYQTQPLHSCLRLYLQAAATGLIGHEPHLSLARDTNEQWAQAHCRWPGTPTSSGRRRCATTSSAAVHPYAAWGGS
jgi:AcrR family transcriptional regulator